MSLSDITAPDPEPTGGEEVDDPTKGNTVDETTATVSDAIPPLVVSEPVNDPPVDSVQEFIDNDGEDKKSDDPPSKLDTLPTIVGTVNPNSPAGSVNLAKPKSFLEQLVDAAVPITEQKIPKKLMLFSDPGQGKTLFLAGIPNNFIIDTEHGRTVMAEYPELIAEGTVPYTFKNMAGLEIISELFKSNPPELEKFKVVSIDTMNKLKERGLQDILNRQFAQNPSFFNKYVPAEDGKEHQEVNAQMKTIVQNFIDSGRDVIISCHAKTFVYKNKQDVIRPDFSEGLGNSLMGMVDTVAYMYGTVVDGKPVRVMKFNPVVGTNDQPQITLKTRIKALQELDSMVDPTWDKMTELWKG